MKKVIEFLNEWIFFIAMAVVIILYFFNYTRVGNIIAYIAMAFVVVKVVIVLIKNRKCFKCKCLKCKNYNYCRKNDGIQNMCKMCKEVGYVKQCKDYEK